MLKHIIFLAGTNRTWKALEFEACRIESDRRNLDGDVLALAACLELEQRRSQGEDAARGSESICSRRTYAMLCGEHII